MASVEKRPNGKWRARYRDEGSREHARHFARKVDAQKWLNEITASIVTGTYASPRAGRITLRAFYEAWAARQVWATGTRRAMDLGVLATPFADMPLGRLKRSHVEAHVKAMTAKLAPGTVHTRYNNLNGVLRAAVADKVIGTNPAEGIRLPRRRKAAAAMEIPTPAEVGKLLGTDFAPFVAVCAFAGLRLGEAAALKVSDIDFLRRTIAVQRQVQRAGGGEVVISPPKYGSERTVYVPAGLTEILAADIAATGATDWVFTGEGDQPPHQNTVGYRWREAKKAAKVSGWTLHHLRHFFASGLIAAGCDVVTVQRALGHASASTTLTTYSHLWPTAEDRTRAASAAMLAEAIGDSADSVRTGGDG